MNTKICEWEECDNEFIPYPTNKRFCSVTCKKRASRRKSNDHFGAYDMDDEDPSSDDITENDVYEIIEELNDLRGKADYLRKDNSRLFNAAVKYKNVSSEIYDGIMSVAKDHIRTITVKPPKEYKFPSTPELIANPWNSDPQLGKRTPTYSSEVAVERIELYTDKVIENTLLMRNSHPIRKAHVWFLGDIVEGEGIFPTQPHVIDSSLYEQVLKTGPSIYGTQLRRLLEIFDEVVVVCVIGNHGRLTRYNNPESNMDRMLYKVLELMFAYEPRIKFVIPDGFGESMFWAVDKIGEYSTLLVHGDQFGPPTTAQSYWKKVLGWKTGGIPVPFQDVAMGHWHQNTKFTLGSTVVRIAGSTESHNTFAQERLGVMGRPSQHLQMIDPNHGVAWESDIHLD